MAEGVERPAEPGLQLLSQVGILSLPDMHWEVLGRQVIFSELFPQLCSPCRGAARIRLEMCAMCQAPRRPWANSLHRGSQALGTGEGQRLPGSGDSQPGHKPGFLHFVDAASVP